MKRAQPAGTRTQFAWWQAVLAALIATALIGCSEPFLANIPLATQIVQITTEPIVPSPEPTPSATLTATAEPTRVKPTPIVVTTTPTPTLIPSVFPTPTATHTKTALVQKDATPLAASEIESSLCFANGTTVQTTFYSAIQDREQNVRVYLPPCYGDDRFNYPALYMLHGVPQSDATWDEVLELDESAEKLIKNGQIPPMIIIMPDGRPLSQTTSGGPGSLEDVILNELIPHVESTWCVSRRRLHRVIGGVSRGAYWSTEIAFRHAKRFGGVGAHSAAFLDEGEHPAINPLYTSTTNDLSGLRIYFDFGRDDTLVNYAIPLHESLLQRDIPHEWIVHDFGGHSEAYWISQTGDYLKWYAEPWAFDRSSYSVCR